MGVLKSRIFVAIAIVAGACLVAGFAEEAKVVRCSLLGECRHVRPLGRESWIGRGKSLLSGRDSHVLVSAQACFLPVPKEGLATFNPVLFNYQSVSGDPAVLTVLATREGTSTTVIDNKRDSFSEGSTWGQ